VLAKLLNGFYRSKKVAQNVSSFGILKELPKVNSLTKGENSPNLGAMLLTTNFCDRQYFRQNIEKILTSVPGHPRCLPTQNCQSAPWKSKN
jgi:hypothetical protein